ncbi:hypothetical protein [Winogradskyella sp. PG-2]|uniref:hypothetical protein n=1 Tax=Winogradskyella sp. PG-2 TaxID=754409 RepID=UPI00045860FA|nr:hypothetical protein [Winogradskyella sp. PG-2]BAO75260.1 hypothetical protein WPG_1030 [Winogradskyella sp. PG-2]
MENKSLKKVIAKSEYNKGKAYLEDLEKETSLSRPYIKVAASIVVLLGLTLTAVFFNNNDNSEDLFADNFEPYNNIVAPISRGNLPKTMEERAFYYYESKDYDKSLKIFDSLLLTQQINKPILNFYKANILLQQDTNLNEAIKLLEANSAKTDKWKDKNLWYLCLGYLKSGNNEKASDCLKKLNDLKSSFKKIKRSKLFKALQ